MISSLRSQLPSESRAVAKLALPVVLGQLCAMGMNVADTMLAGRHSAHTLGVVGVGSAIWSIVIIASLGLLFAVPPMVSELDGAGRRDRIAAVVSQAIWLAILIGIVLFFGVRSAEPLLRLMKVDPLLIPDVMVFLRLLSFGTPALAMFFALRYFSEGIGYTRATLYFSALGVLVFLPIGNVLVFGHFGVPALGSRGCAIAMAASLWIQVLAFALFVLRHPVYRDIDLPGRFERPNWIEMRKLLALGLPIGFMVLMEGSLFVVAALLIASLGTTAVAGHQIAINLGSVAFMVPLGIGAATTVRVGNALGANDPVRLRAAVASGLLIALVMQVLMATAMAVFAHELAGLYSHDQAVVVLAAQLLIICAVFQFSDGMQAVAASALRGLQDVRVPALLTLVAYWLIGMSIGHWLAFDRALGVHGMWWGLAAGLSAAAVLLLTRLWLQLRARPIATEVTPTFGSGQKPA
jgi:multidrug resistance protein, MATE family